MSFNDLVRKEAADKKVPFEKDTKSLPTSAKTPEPKTQPTTSNKG